LLTRREFWDGMARAELKAMVKPGFWQITIRIRQGRLDIGKQ